MSFERHEARDEELLKGGKTMSFSILLLASALMFSDTRGSVHGKVWDPTGAVVVGAVVTAENIIDGHSWVAQTNNEGEYELDHVQTGHYRMKAEVRGFQAAVQYTIIGAGQRAEVNFHLVLSVMPAGEVSVADSFLAVELREMPPAPAFNRKSHWGGKASALNASRYVAPWISLLG
jgi:hypothetical protein